MSLDYVVLNEHKTKNHLHADDGIDHIFSSGSVTTGYTTGQRKITINSIGNFNFGSTVDFKLLNSSSYAYNNILLKLNLGNTGTSDYADRPAMSCIERVTILSNDERVLQEFDYNQVMKHLLSSHKATTKAQILAMAGGSSFGLAAANVDVFAPIPIFFSDLWSPEQKSRDFPAYLLNGELKVRIKFRALADTLKPTATGGSMDVCQLVAYVSTVPQSIVEVHKQNADKYSYHTNIASTMDYKNIVTGTSTNVDIKQLSGNLMKSLKFDLALTSDRTTNAIWNENSIAVDSYELSVNNDTLFETLSDREAVADKLFMHGQDESSDNVYTIPFSYSPHASIYSGGFNTANLQDIKLNAVNHSQGANCDLYITSIDSVAFIVKNGVIKLVRA